MDAFLRTWEEFVNIATIGNDFDRIVLSKVKPHYKNGKFIIVTKDEFTKTWIEKNYLDRIKSTFKYYDLDVEIVVENNVNQDNLKVEETKETKKYTMKENTTKTSKTSKISRENETEKIEGNVVVLEKSDEEKSFNYQVNPKYTFDSFVVGPSNDFAYHAALNVSKYPGKNYNPLFIYGGVGLGKTHLLHAIVNATTKETKLKKILYVTSEQFTNDFFKALNSKTLHSFRIKYREADILLIDDVQFFKSTMKQAIEELFHTFNKLIHDKKQMVFTSDRTPRELEEISDRMISRFEGGLVVEIRKPELETRIRIIEEKLKDEKIEIKDEYKRFIAENIVSNVRSLEAAVNRISAFVSFKKGELNLSTLKTLLKDLIETNTKEEVIEITYTFDEIVKAVAKYYEISYEKIIDNSRTDQLMFARQVAMYLIKRLTNLTFSQIAERFGKVHSTAMRAYERIDSLIKRDLLIKQQIKEIISILKSTKNY